MTTPPAAKNNDRASPSVLETGINRIAYRVLGLSPEEIRTFSMANPGRRGVGAIVH